jgi:hypothetical protein
MTRTTPPVPLSSVTSTANPTVAAAGDETVTGPNVGGVKSVAPAGA